MNAPADTTPPPLERPRQSRLGLVVLLVILVAGVTYIVSNVADGRSAGLASVVTEYAVWVALLGIAMARSPSATLRISDPYLALLGIGFNFLVTPGVVWLHGADLEEAWFEFGRIRIDLFVQIQWLHVMFMLALSATYFAIAPRHRLAPEDRSAPLSLPDGTGWILFGLLPLAFGVAERVITTGSLTATQNYGDIWTSDQANIAATQVEGGSALVAMQVLGKIWFLPWLALGIGEGLLLSRLVRRGARLPLVLFALQLPVMLVLGSGGRSIIVAPFFIALLVADALVGPLRWRWVLGLGGVAMVGLNFFGIYRGYRDRDVGEALTIANERFNSVSRGESLSAESSIMLIKEHFAVAWTDANNFSRGLSYFTESVLSLFPQQLVPEKVHFMGTANFLSHELLGSSASAGAGVAGSIIVDGYMIGRELGVIVLGATLGAVSGGIARALSGGRAGRPMLWEVVILMSWSLQGIHFFRNDFAAILSQMASVIALPALGFALWTRMSPRSFWARRLSNEP
jgi:hypothetical protein